MYALKCDRCRQFGNIELVDITAFGVPRMPLGWWQLSTYQGPQTPEDITHGAGYHMCPACLEWFTRFMQGGNIPEGKWRNADADT